MTDNLALHTRRRLGVVLLGLLLLTASAVTASAAGSTTVSLHETGATTDVGGTTTVDVVVESADGGVGTYNATVVLEDPDVASVEDVELAGDPELEDVDVAEDGAGVTIRTALMNTSNSGQVTIAMVTVAGDAVGESDVSLAVTTLGDEEGRAYSVTETRGSSVAVSKDDDDDDDDHESSSGPTDSANTDQSTDEFVSTDAAGTDDDSAGSPTSTESDQATTSATTSPEPPTRGETLPLNALTVALFAAAVLSAGLLLTRRVR